MSVVLQRIYEEDSKLGGYRVLIDGIWPRGISKEDAGLDEWAKTLAPSSSLRKWFNHDKEKFEEFRSSYKQELQNGNHQEELQRLKEKSDGGRVVLLYGTKEKEYNHAVVMKEILESKK
ncbi:hypothetical protein AAV35_001405 [Salimicrobium jeotgali]|uniref:Uroporphyrin-III C-methyltransferase n=1 Tax=Salimicrobium jeotgali TaxID=1230341 RepID=K2GAG5_9BACI|nr:DUF488 family protein [Salimicrobium jeotgali]AKG03571.1 hypothetical protein AAV35_001405 [Salimicrobium jeotgali]EKE32063.1 hypothetical protein MJ3_05568 [Salimicrobium jeotgali]MBM7696031.1 uncharacterized protein YeaO (DUF488 family) [Salimicrobium jeotgali]